MKTLGKQKNYIVVLMMLCLLLTFSMRVFAGTVSGGDVVEPMATISQGDSLICEDVLAEAEMELVKAVEDGTEVAGMNLSVPSNLDFVIDPWGIGGKGQIYSTKFVIRNEGESSGILYLHDIFGYQDEKMAVFVNGKEEIYGTDSRNVYLKMVFSTGEEVVITEACSELEISMEAGQEIVFWLDGNVNEKTTDSWADVVVHVSMKYNWVNVS